MSGDHAEDQEYVMDPATYQELEQLEDDFEDVELEMSKFPRSQLYSAGAHFRPILRAVAAAAAAAAATAATRQRNNAMARARGERKQTKKSTLERETNLSRAVRHQHNLSKELHERRTKLVAKIPHFWPLVIEQSPPDIDEYIQPTDAALLMNSLTGISVERFELPGGDPRSIAITWHFSENDHFENTSIEKKFYWRNAKDGWAGLVSEPVTIQWKEGKDLTNGMLDLVRKVYDEEVAAGAKADEETEAKKALKTQMENTGLDGLSFFAWFGFRGRKISDEEHKEATKIEQEKRQKRKEGKLVEDDDMDEDDDDEDDDEYEWEIFPTADDLAVSIAEDLWPNAIKYFSKFPSLPSPLLDSKSSER